MKGYAILLWCALFGLCAEVCAHTKTPRDVGLAGFGGADSGALDFGKVDFGVDFNGADFGGDFHALDFSVADSAFALDSGKTDSGSALGFSKILDSDATPFYPAFEYRFANASSDNTESSNAESSAQKSSQKSSLDSSANSSQNLAKTPTPFSLLESKPPLYYKPHSRGEYLGTTIGLLSGGVVVAIIGLYLMPESVTNWDRSRFGFNVWVQDVKIGPVLDNDNFILNGISHPYFGAVYYMQPRVAGYSWAESALFSFITSSIFWEYGIEAFVEIPSWQDLIYTPAMGSIFGEIFYQSTKYIQNHEYRLLNSKILGYTIVALMDPIGVIMRDLGLAKLVGIENAHAPAPRAQNIVESSARSKNAKAPKKLFTSYVTPLGFGFALRF
ncbi:hypothetical protein BKN38_05930 [Helicobacter sp. CLO-3]|nr:hypothetical protein BA723_05440 [Helicobacter sp. CLO-3]OHU83075.1 hypothetical protein BKN38_05930 [Helicobacter sp. CLO-3]